MRGPALQAATERSSIDFDAVTRGDPLTIYIVMPPHMLGSHGRLLRLWVGALMTAIMRRRARPEASTLFVLDEAAQLGTFNERSEEHTSELQSLMRNSYAVFCLKKNKTPSP